MHARNHLLTRFMIAALLSASLSVGACGHGGGTRFYDPYYGDYHRWNRSELGFYGQWESQTGRSHMGFGQRSVGEQHAYLNWRHQH
jgi:hypothetical protein